MKGKKIIVPVLLASLVASPAAVGVNAALSKVSASSTTPSTTPLKVEGPDVTITGYKEEVEKGGEITVPTIAGGVSHKITLTTPYGSKTVTKLTGDVNNRTETTIDVAEVTSGMIIKAEETGYYTFGIEVEGTDSISSVYEELSVFVKGNSYSMNMIDNSYFVVPANIDFVSGGTTVKFPVPEVYKNGEKTTATAGKIQLVVTKPNGVEVDPITTVSTDTATGEQYFEYKFEAEGRYRYKYKYVDGGTTLATMGTKTVKLVSGYDLSDVELDFSLVKAMPTSAIIGQEVELPEINVFDKYNSDKYLDAYTKITVTYIGEEEVSEAEKTQVVKDFKFTPKYAGTYTITYEASIPLWNKTTGQRTYKIKDVRDSKAPEFYYTNSYTVENDGTIKVGTTDITDKTLDEQLELLGDRTNWLDAYYEVGTDGKVTVALPALYAVDNSDNINEILEYSTRELYKKGSSSNTLTLVNSTGLTEAKINEVAYFTFDNDGSWGADDNSNYIVKYVISDSLNNKDTKYYNIYIRNINKLPNEGPQITLDPALTDATVNVGETLKFSAPVVVDKHDGKVYDANVDVKTYISYDSKDDRTTEIKANENGEFEVTVTDDTKDTLYIITEARNNYHEEASVKYAEIKINDPADDVDAPELNVLTGAQFNTALLDANEITGITLDQYGKNGAKGAFNQNAVITVPAMTFTDASSSLNLSAVVTYKANNNETAKTVKLSNFTVTSGENEDDDTLTDHTITGAQFTASNAGYYYVTYIAEDNGNNVSFKTYAIYVNDTVGPRIEVPNASKYNDSIRPGQWFEIPSAIAYDNGVLSTEKITPTITGPNGGCVRSSDGKSFRPLKPGTYYVTYSTQDGAGNPSTSEPYALEVKAELNEETFYIDFATTDYETDLENVTYKTDSTLINPFVVLVPKATAVDLDMNTKVNVAKPKVVDGNNIEKEVSDYVRQTGDSDEEFAEKSRLYYQFTATTQGVHTVTYSATSEFGISIPKSYEIKVGDVYAPELKWKDKTNDLVSTVEVGDSWTFDLDNVVITDEGSDDTIANEGIEYTITMYDPDGTEVKVDDYTYTFDKIGDYKFTVKLTDKAGNTTGNEHSYKITVNEKEETVNPINNTTGTILIVTSVVVLGGVVIYFVVSGRKMSASTKKASKKDNKKEEK